MTYGSRGGFDSSITNDSIELESKALRLTDAHAHANNRSNVLACIGYDVIQLSSKRGAMLEAVHKARFWQHRALLFGLLLQFLTDDAWLLTACTYILTACTYIFKGSQKS